MTFQNSFVVNLSKERIENLCSDDANVRQMLLGVLKRKAQHDIATKDQLVIMDQKVGEKVDNGYELTVNWRKKHKD